MVLSPRIAEQLKWSRFINVHGLPGHNVSCDLHMEHLNREAKASIVGLGPNKSQKAIRRTGKALGPLTETLENFDEDNHAPKSGDKDLQKIIKQLTSSQAFKVIPITNHSVTLEQI